MIHEASVALVRAWARNGIIDSADTEAYQYGLELFLSTAVNLAVMICLSAAVGHPWYFAPYLAAFIPLRLTAGGYHAKHHWGCILFNAVTYFAGLFIEDSLQAETIEQLCIIESRASLVTLAFLAPASAPNKPLTAEEKKRNRWVFLSISVLLLALCQLLYRVQMLRFGWCQQLFFGQLMASVYLVLGKLCSLPKT